MDGVDMVMLTAETDANQVHVAAAVVEITTTVEFRGRTPIANVELLVLEEITPNVPQDNSATLTAQTVHSTMAFPTRTEHKKRVESRTITTTAELRGLLPIHNVEYRVAGGMMQSVLMAKHATLTAQTVHR
ncbi:chitinase [Thalassiosira pseudonana CCMP1335]|uniref:Chitinase n=1 Tax=Thalassiosira pseudonana TaxID=35128 RepID=B8CGB1_THAPS|nr:chitinase [Thalassiosira pseudonana CCMP1335]EED87461.1 chitinase [Thalassiosira pseudonana CCMP1335]